jgi:hypothetical protein
MNAAEDRCCTNCGKSVEDEAYGAWLFHTCQSCALDATARHDDAGSARKWKYFPRWHMTRHPSLPKQTKERYKRLA